MASKVYYMNDRANSLQESTPFKAVKLLRDAGIKDLFKKGDTVGIKMHMGEYGNSLNLRPQWVKAIVEEVQKLGGKPVVVDCSTVVFAENAVRAVAADHLWTASRHGFNEETMGCPIWICDGEYGFDDVQDEVPNGVYMKHSFIGKKMLELDAVIVVSHFKGHPMGVFGGAVKNVGIGMSSKRGKGATHFFSHPVYGLKNAAVKGLNQAVAKQLTQGPAPTLMDRLITCCPFDVYEWKDEFLHFHGDRCTSCSACFGQAINSGLLSLNPEIFVTWPTSIADSAAAHINAIGKDKFLYLNYVMDVTPWCDCMNYHDRSMVPNLGVFASKDPVAVDMACLEATEASVVIPESKPDEFGFGEPNSERFTNCSSMAKISQWAQINSAQFNGLGTTEYVLIESEPGDEYDFWPRDYTPSRTVPMVHKEGLSSGSYDPGDYVYELPRLSVPELQTRPKGIVKQISIVDEE